MYALVYTFSVGVMSGANSWGQLGRGDNTTNVGDDPDEVGDNLVGVSVGGTVSEMALGGEHTCMLVDSGEVVCFGHNDKGQLGLEDTANRGQIAGSVGETVDFGAGLSAVAVAAGCEHTCGLLDDGSVKCFGYNNFGQLGQVIKRERLARGVKGLRDWERTKLTPPSSLRFVFVFSRRK